MVKPDERTLSAIESLRGHRDWETIVKWLRESLNAVFAEQGIFYADTARYLFNAGRNAELTDLIRKIENARETAQAMRKK